MILFPERIGCSRLGRRLQEVRREGGRRQKGRDHRLRDSRHGLHLKSGRERQVSG